MVVLNKKIQKNQTLIIVSVLVLAGLLLIFNPMQMSITKESNCLTQSALNQLVVTDTNQQITIKGIVVKNHQDPECSGWAKVGANGRIRIDTQATDPAFKAFSFSTRIALHTPGNQGSQAKGTARISYQGYSTTYYTWGDPTIAGETQTITKTHNWLLKKNSMGDKMEIYRDGVQVGVVGIGNGIMEVYAGAVASDGLQHTFSLTGSYAITKSAIPPTEEPTIPTEEPALPSIEFMGMSVVLLAIVAVAVFVALIFLSGIFKKKKGTIVTITGG